MKKIVIIVVVFTLVSALPSCKKFLDKEPDNRAKLNTPEKVSELLATAYPQSSYRAMAELSSDNVGDCQTNYNDQSDWNVLNHDLYFYNDNLGVTEDGPKSYWNACYAAIAAANQALATISTVTDPQNYQAQKGEALVARAYAHFMLVNFYAKFYNASTAASDMGIPYVTEPETVSIKKYDRKSVKYVYDMVEKDLLEGLPLINNTAYPQTDAKKYHFTTSAANAFASRYYLYKEDYDNVIKYAQAALPENNYASNLRPWNTVYANLPLNGNGSIDQTYSKATENANLLLVETKSWWLRILYSCRYNLTPSMERYLVGSGVPASTGLWAMRSATYFTGHPIIPTIDEYFVETSIGSGIGDGWEIAPLFTSEEVLFNLAEAYTYKGQTAQAINLLNTYLSTRVDGYTSSDNISETSIKDFYGVTDVQEGLIYLLLDYRQTEFIHQGMRWFDILRYGIEVKHDLENDYGVVIDSIKLGANNLHRVFQIPATAVSQAGLETNPR